MHDSKLDLRDPEKLGQVFSIYSHLYGKAVQANRLPWEWPVDRSIQVDVLSRYAQSNCLYQANPTYYLAYLSPRLPFLQAHFGYPGRTSFHEWESGENFLEVLPGNPVRLPNGRWEGNKDGVEVVLRLKHAAKPKFLEEIAKNKKAFELKMQGPVRKSRL